MGDNDLVLMVDDEWLNYETEEKILNPHGYGVRHVNPDNLTQIIDDIGRQVIGIIVRATIHIKKDDMKKLTRCRVISVTGGGYDGIDLVQATAMNIVVAYQGDYCLEEVSDHTMALLFALEKNLFYYHSKVVNEKKWLLPMPRPTYRIRNRVLGLVGLGKISELVAKKALCFGLKVIAFDPYVDADKMASIGVKKVAIEELQENSDYISFHIPLTDKTKKMIDEKFLTRTRDGVIIINTCRGGVIDEAALYSALKSGKVAAAGLDVLAKEPPDPDNPLLTLPNVILTPHISYRSVDSIRSVRELAAQAVLSVIQGEKPGFIANP